ncbi:hypothetical protein [Roseovarius sp.]|uniref:hypothetical protein n=1 Tax=Roseovarius sp. TaxID=1486281 RepID=UPI00263829E5|nr:hypothetical protein [Roseovarius sp.]
MTGDSDEGGGENMPRKPLQAAPMPKQQPLTRVQLNEGLQKGRPTGPGNVRIERGENKKKK